MNASPKYINVNPPPYEDASMLEAYNEHPPQDASQRLLDLFLSDVAARQGMPSIRTLLKLYTSIDASKLAAFSDAAEDGSALGEEDLLQQLMVLKSASRTYARQNDESLLDGDRLTTNNLDFTIEGVSRPESSDMTVLTQQSMVHVEETTSHRRFAGFFIRNAEHAQRVFNSIRSAPLPSKERRQPQQQQQQPAQGATAATAAAATGKPGAGAWQPKRVRVAAQ